MLHIIATPIGDPKDITIRALETLQSVDILIGEERRIASTLLKRLHIPPKELYLLNEHSKESDIEFLAELCQSKNVGLISDCGTPSFYDPGYQLVALCRKRNIPVRTLPGASSLMALLSLVSERVSHFFFAGFLSAESEKRASQWKTFLARQEPLVVMDTPYRLKKVLAEIELFAKNRKVLLGLNLTQEFEEVMEGRAQDLIPSLHQRGIEKAEFILLLYAEAADERPKPKALFKKRARG